MAKLIPFECPKCKADLGGEYNYQAISVIFDKMQCWECPHCDYVWEE